ncbi:folate-binding protein [Pelagibacteraceae bacterium]|jgi:folate-binding protein YgfZ|nr:folate-binding protein [Pelagibacteraceae bacterium]
MIKEQVIILEDRGLISVSGEDSKDFLQNILTNDINKVSNSKSLFTGIFTPQGKYLYEFFVVKSKDGFFLDCDSELTNEIIEHLFKYKIRSKIEIKNLSSEYVVGIISLDKFNEIQVGGETNFQTILYGESQVFIDPRTNQLGARILSNLDKLYLTIKKLGLKIVDKKNYLNLTHLHGIPVHGIKNLKDKLFGLEANFNELEAIDFKKGCYIGQENTARMKLKNKIRRRLIPVFAEDELDINSEIIFKNKVIGTILIPGPNAFALFKLFDPHFAEYEKEELLCKNIKLKIIRPFFFQSKN